MENEEREVGRSEGTDSDDAGTYETNKNEKVTRMPLLSIFRESPRPCVNQALVDELKILRWDRFLNFGTASPEFISYATACSAVISLPVKIRTHADALKLPKVGNKIAAHIEEFINYGHIPLARQRATSEDYKVKSLLNQVHGIGPTNARKLYDSGVRTMEDLAAIKDVDGNPRYNLKYHDDSLIKIPRTEVESVRDFVQIQLDRMDELNKTGRKAVITICGGYRRGKSESNDIDLLICYPHSAEGTERGVLRELIKRLKIKGFIPSDGILSEFHTATERISLANRSASLLDCLDKAFIVFKHPANGKTRMRDYYRRVDLIVTRWETYGAAVLGWTGSTQFERDLRKHASSLGYIFESGGLRSEVGEKSFDTPYERELFRRLGIPYLPPELRNADP